ncbi:MAG: polysaccharide biosynthesis/export family protein [Prevotellaceae bacterium]|jgi:polysaccharide export outer membrane protein|nr:polysaccharide biosynthesis/export family protein [Prevotellaceae bacterium]
MMEKKYFNRLIFILSGTAILFLNSCTAYKKLPYLQGATNAELLRTRQHEPRIMPNDIITITVNSNVEGAATNFNLPLVPANIGNITQTTTSGSGSGAGSLQNYLVDTRGNINFPVLGTLKVAGKTLKEAQEYITSLIYPQYIVEEPVVNVRLLNFQVAVLGEVTRPGTYSAANGQMTVFDALAAAGDMTIYGKRNNILLVRTNENGQTKFFRFDIQDKNFIANQELFFLQQNDKLYVETNKAKGNNSAFGTLQSLGVSVISVAMSAISLISVLQQRYGGN